MGRLWNDIRFALRAVRRKPGFTAVVILTHALGIGIAAAVFSVFYGILLTPLPYSEPQQLVAVYDVQPACETCPASFPKYHDWRERNRVFADVGGSTSASFVLTQSGDPVRLSGARTTASLVDVFGVQPQIGRWYTEEEDIPGGPKVVVLSHGLWTRQFNADRNIPGRKLILDGEPYEVIGVMPASFIHRRGEFYVPLQLQLDRARGGHFLGTFARMKEGVTLESARAQMRDLGEEMKKEFSHNHGIDVQSLTEVVVGQVRGPLNLLLGAVGFLLLIGSANVANLLLASGLARRRELAIRMALGAGPNELARQLATESTLLALAGGAGGILLAQWIVPGFILLAGNSLPRAGAVALNATVIGFAAGVSLLVGLLCSLWPILAVCRQELAQSVREGDQRGTTSSGRKLGSSLVVAEIALACALLLGAGLLMKNLMLLQQRDTGFRTDRIVAFDVDAAGARYSSAEPVVAFYRDLYARLSQVSSIESVGMTSHLPMYNFGWNNEFQIEGGVPWDAKDAPLVEYRWIYGDYFKTMGVPLLAGRMLDERDRGGTRTVLINQAMAEKFWPGQNPLGRRFGNGEDLTQWHEVVGVVGNMRSYGLARSTPYEFYRNIEQSSFNSMTVVLRTRSENPAEVIPVARQIVGSLDASLPITAVQTMEQVVASSVGQPRLLSVLTGLFGTLAGLLAVVGVYGVMAYNVRRQMREFGIRIALGAGRGDVTRLVVGRGAILALLGVAIGCLVGWMLSGVLKTMLHDVKPTDATVYAATAIVVIGAAMLAAYLPARSAARVDPAVVLREN
ncbi:MAG TPA: ABC transporter permease [Candidatus Acidoferrales bacterium]